MIKPNTTIYALAASLTICLAEGAEEKVSLEEIPAAAAKTLKEQAGGEKIKSLSKEKDEGKTVYEASFSKKGRAHDVTVDEKGKLISDEEVIPLAEAPDAVRAAIEKEHPGGKVDKIEKITEGHNISYEALISAKGKREEIKFDDKGKVLEREDKTGIKGND